MKQILIIFKEISAEIDVKNGTGGLAHKMTHRLTLCRYKPNVDTNDFADEESKPTFSYHYYSLLFSVEGDNL